jgi:hypothetical protein
VFLIPEISNFKVCPYEFYFIWNYFLISQRSILLFFFIFDAKVRLEEFAQDVVLFFALDAENLELVP